MDSAPPALQLCLPCRGLSVLAEKLLAQGMFGGDSTP